MHIYAPTGIKPLSECSRRMRNSCRAQKEEFVSTEILAVNERHRTGPAPPGGATKVNIRQTCGDPQEMRAKPSVSTGSTNIYQIKTRKSSGSIRLRTALTTRLGPLPLPCKGVQV